MPSGLKGGRRCCYLVFAPMPPVYAAYVPWLSPLQETALLLLGGLTFSMESLLRVLLRSSVEANLSESVRLYSRTQEKLPQPQPQPQP